MEKLFSSLSAIYEGLQSNPSFPRDLRLSEGVHFNQPRNTDPAHVGHAADNKLGVADC